MRDDPRLEAFYALSSELTGFDRFDLEGTGVAAVFFGEVMKRVGQKTLADLFAVWAQIDAEADPDKRNEAISTRIMGDEALAPTAQRIIMLWYVGSWYDSPPFGSEVISSQSYIEGLVWKAIGSHPMAAKAQGYGAWALPPPGATRKSI